MKYVLSLTEGFARRTGGLAALAALVVLAVLAAVPATAVPLEWAPSPVAVRLLAPADGATLEAGASAELAWELASPLAAAPITEWEAFLSLDGGATSSVRITPHLDLDRRRVSFRVPDVPAVDARILLRLGDERREAPVFLPQRFTIAEGPGAAPACDLASLFAVSSLTAGEPALPGAAGVVAWAEGGRTDGPWREVSTVPSGLGPGFSYPALAPESAVAASWPPEPRAATVQTGSRSPFAGPSRPSRPPARRPRPLQADLLALQHRLNE